MTMSMRWLAGAAAFIVTFSLTGVALRFGPALLQRIAQHPIWNPSGGKPSPAGPARAGSALLDEVAAKVLPVKGFQSKIALGDSLMKLAAAGVVDPGKFAALYQDRGGLPDELKDVLSKPSARLILLTRENAGVYVNLLWAIGLANYMAGNEKSPVNGDSLFNFASTGGWTLGKEENGGAYFNKFPIVELTPEQEALVLKIAQSTFRPCCDNSTFFQDCNHGSALLGLLQLGASQGLTEEELYREALAFSAFWFPDQYIRTALYFKAVKNTGWESVDPKLALGETYSSASGWSVNVDKEVRRLGLVPQEPEGAGCGV